MAGWTDDAIETMNTPVVAFDPRLALGEGQRTLSWIWYSVSERELEGDSRDVAAALRVEWAKTRARAHRWREEIVLLEEEMRRALESCLWHSRWWQSRAERSVGLGGYVAEGLAAYAWEQSLAEKERTVRWSSQWSAVRERAQSVLTGQLDSLPVIVVEIDAEEEEETDDDEAEEDA